MPTSTRQNAKRPARVRTATQKALDSSPLGPATKKRKVNGTAKRPPRAVSPEVDDRNDDSTDTNSVAEPQDLANMIIPHLSVSKDPVEVARQCANETFLERGGNDIEAYAKVCGRDWTYYIQEPRVKIGRAPEAPRHNVVSGLQSSPIAKKTSPMNIDLGPSKMISREHAEFSFDGKSDKWQITVLGRNGVKFNNELLKNTENQIQTRHVSSGDILEIAGTQMIFITANEQTKIHPTFSNLLHQVEVSDEEAKSVNGLHGFPMANITHPSSSQKRPHESGAMVDSRMAAPPSSDFLRPNTPLRPKKIAPSSGATQPSSTSQSFSLGRGHSLTSSESIDYRQPAYKDLKPPFSYACLIARAIFSTEEQAITLSDLYGWIRSNFSYFRNFDPHWDPAWGDSRLPPDLQKRLNTMQNSVRHNLSVHDLFTKVPRRSDEPGKGMKWRVAEEKLDEAYKLVEKQTTKGGGSKRRSRSNPSSPVVHGRNGESAMLRTSPPSTQTPPRSVPLDIESQTPIHRPNQHAHPTLPRILSDEPSLPHPHFLSDASPLPHAPQTHRRRRTLTTAPGGSSPTLTSGAWAGYPSTDNPSSFFTPAPKKHNLNNNLYPGTAKLPTSHMADSSPAPFWKFAGQTPGEIGASGLPLAFGSSPVKVGGDGGAGAGLGIASQDRSDSSSSSPVAPASPSANRNGSTLAVDNFAHMTDNAAAGTNHRRESQGNDAEDLTQLQEDEDEAIEGGIDLLKGFQSIGRFHGRGHLQAAAMIGGREMMTPS